MNNEVQAANTTQAEMGYELTTRLVNQIIEKNYLSNLENMSVLPFPSLEYNDVLTKIRMYKISEIVFSEEEDITQKLANVYNAFSNRKDSLFLLIDSNHDGVKLYLGVRPISADHSVVTSAELLKKSLIGQFPGIALQSQSNSEINVLQNQLKENTCFSAISSIPSLQNKETAKNGVFIQGLEKVINSLQGENYQGIVLSSNINKSEINDLRLKYENIYSQLVPLKKTSITFGQNQSFSKGSNASTSISTSDTMSDSVSYSYSESQGISKTVGSSNTSENALIARGVGGVLQAAGKVISIVNPVGTVVSGIGGGIKRTFGNEQRTESEGITTSDNKTNSTSTSTSQSTTHGKTKGTSTNSQTGQTQSKQTEYENKTISNMLNRLDKQFERMSDFDDTSAWEFAAYFMSKEADIAEIAGSTYQSVISGDDSGIQVAAVNHWFGNGRVDAQTATNISEIQKYLGDFMHPEFVYNEFTNQPMAVRATSIISSSELAISMGLPRQSVVGVPVIKHARFAQNAFHLDNHSKEIRLGSIYQVGSTNSTMPTVNLQLNSLSGHTFITGSTGSGKSNTVYQLLAEALTKGIHFMVVEPAKGEYKNVFGNREDVNVYGTNP